MNTSMHILDEERIEKIESLYGYPQEFMRSQLENDELNHATATYFLIDQEKEF